MSEIERIGIKNPHIIVGKPPSKLDDIYIDTKNDMGNQYTKEMADRYALVISKKDIQETLFDDKVRSNPFAIGKSDIQVVLIGDQVRLSPFYNNHSPQYLQSRLQTAHGLDNKLPYKIESRVIQLENELKEIRKYKEENEEELKKVTEELEKIKNTRTKKVPDTASRYVLDDELETTIDERKRKGILSYFIE